MNAQHTPGTIRYDCYCGELIASNGGTVATFTDEPSEADARRLVACWNALIDLPQEALDGGWTRAGLEAHAMKLEQQRDELLAVIENILWNRKPGDQRSPMAILTEVEVIAKNAIAKVEGGAA